MAPPAGGEEVKEMTFGCLGSSHISISGSLPLLRRRGGLPGDFLGAGAASCCVRIRQFSMPKYAKIHPVR